MLTFMYLVKHLAMPPSFILFLLLAGFLLILARLRRLGMVLLALGVLLYYGLSVTPTANWLLRPLESRYPPITAERLPRVGTLVVLGGGVSATAVPSSSRLSRGTIKRLVEAVRVYNLMDRPRLVVCGGQANPFVQVSEAEVMREFLMDLGIPAKQIITESESRNTFESVKALERLPLRRPLILITSASHMPRAMRVFASAGEQPLPAPCDFRIRGGRGDPLHYFPSTESLSASTHAIYEYLGTWWYKVAGYF